MFARVAKLAFCHRGPGDIAVFGTSGESTSTRLFGASDEKYQKKREVEFENRKTVAENRKPLLAPGDWGLRAIFRLRCEIVPIRCLSYVDEYNTNEPTKILLMKNLSILR